MKTTTIINGMIAIMLGSMSMGALAENLTLGTKATASLVASCQIQAQSISFGALALPISAQSANSNISVLCSKEAPYKIDLSYGLSTNYWATTSSGGRYDTSTWRANTALYDSTGKVIKTSSFSYPQSSNSELKTLLATAMNCTYAGDGKCYAPISSTNPATSGGSGNMYGVKGDNVAYNISLPGDTSKIWNIGKNSYLGTGTGLSQNIPVQAQLVPSGSTPYPTPDMYTDTVTATVTY